MSYIVRIPEPCNEDWNKMSPETTGRHCTVCAKIVIDFSEKTDTEIHTILKENSDKKVCGHFKKTQVDRPLKISIPWHLIPRNVSSTKAFAMALFFVFGTFLFSCTSENGRKVGEIGIEQMAVMGDVAFPLPPLEDTTIADSVKIDTTGIDGELKLELIHPEEFTNGGIGYYHEEFIDPVPPIEPLIDSVPEMTMAGGVVYMIEPPVSEINPETVCDESAELEKKENGITPPEKIATLFPNPNSGEFNIQYEVKQKGTVQIDIYDINGAFIKNVVNNQVQHTGKYVLPTNLKDVANGVYICCIVVNGKKITERIVIEK